MSRRIFNSPDMDSKAHNRQLLKCLVLILIPFSLNVTAKPESEKRRVESIQSKTESLNDVQLESYDWKGEIPESRVVVLKNPYGSIRSRNHLDDKVYLHSTIQMIGQSPIKPRFVHEFKQGQLFIEVKYDQPVKDENGELKARADISILFPDTVSIFAETDFGLIKIDKTASHVQAKTNSGNIKLKTTGLFKAESQTGKISLWVRGHKTAGESAAKSKSGKIEATIFNDMEVAVVAKSNSRISLDGKNVDPGRVHANGKDPLNLKLVSDSGEINIQFVTPPALVKSVKPSTPTSADVDLRSLPKSKSWKPGDPVYDRDDKKDNSLTKVKAAKSKSQN